mmetsp:Transcript_48561/g.147736  ORF Transcript_48561/g.147736 Transcript_48561/m.147736 type:complete len:358 (+) Transcript_48561:340-1413(+)
MFFRSLTMATRWAMLACSAFKLSKSLKLRRSTGGDCGRGACTTGGGGAGSSASSPTRCSSVCTRPGSAAKKAWSRSSCSSCTRRSPMPAYWVNKAFSSPSSRSNLPGVAAKVASASLSACRSPACAPKLSSVDSSSCSTRSRRDACATDEDRMPTMSPVCFSSASFMPLSSWSCFSKASATAARRSLSSACRRAPHSSTPCRVWSQPPRSACSSFDMRSAMLLFLTIASPRLFTLVVKTPMCSSCAALSACASAWTPRSSPRVCSTDARRPGSGTHWVRKLLSTPNSFACRAWASLATCRSLLRAPRSSRCRCDVSSSARTACSSRLSAPPRAPSRPSRRWASAATRLAVARTPSSS